MLYVWFLHHILKSLPVHPIWLLPPAYTCASMWTCIQTALCSLQFPEMCQLPQGLPEAPYNEPPLLCWMCEACAWLLPDRRPRLQPQLGRRRWIAAYVLPFISTPCNHSHVSSPCSPNLPQPPPTSPNLPQPNPIVDTCFGLWPGLL